ncbi:5-(carboxyamino)imidazole ribonucleotide synthase [Marinobacter nanhaiticus D15-8W]|uniref:N5-carboxyaminoimidazole ribonucleotide synthase n=1 Tax=Marinobacter nanhaiticus D15-8W TaxID=626887 RepID=N6W371_9GAMM|nr:5-(carboxyamino)imidazole ribonucleotide synthase [Marinobacter nanhaiticus]ENO16995.2 5-(carboxyamino)imidazole ribonucleotide synthase [Marinobacter nanhaiticus D15-8W]BES72009.1 5-(carboxyamino)imidazole ribonucleotide synthase [Marinobacter nanhaiticus D15-8W]
MRIGVLGAGQLGRMLALAGYPLANQFVFYDLSGSPSAGLGEVIIDRNHEYLKDFLARVDRVTYEFEHLPVEVAEIIAREKTVYPSPRALQVCQNRESEKTLFGSLGIPTPEWRVAESAVALEKAAEELGCPVVAKSNTEGYDGKGQAVLRSPEEAAAAWASIGHEKLVVEKFVDFTREVSVVAVRGEDGEVAIYPMAENVHSEGILRYSIAPAPHLRPEIQERAERYIRTLLNELEYVGVLALELFETEDGLVANEMAPRVHNSGHWTMDGAHTSQFENHIRAVTGMPLGNVSARDVSCMVNIIGEHGSTDDILRLPYAHLHLYGKLERPGRKLGHVNIVADSYEELVWRVKNCACFLPGAPELECSLTRR